jgi:hypothetical protein
LIDAVEMKTGKSIEVYEHVLFCLPLGSSSDGNDSWAAFSILGGRVSENPSASSIVSSSDPLTYLVCEYVYVLQLSFVNQLTFYNEYCDRISILMHEIGHNLR